VSNRAILASKLIGISIALVALIWIVFGQTLGHQFVNLDDGTYVYRNSQVTRGISVDGTKWAFTHPVAANWHPITILSHMLDCQLYGLAPAGHHFTNVALHSIAAILLLVILFQMTDALWPSAFVAAVFAIHPLRVESVAWVAERKDVLSAVFFMLTMISYVRYAKRPSWQRYMLMAILFSFGLLAKPMLVTLPLVLLLLDYWPLQRFDHLGDSSTKSEKKFPKRPWKWLVLEKVPLLALSAAASVGAIITQERSINLMRHVSPGSRIGNAFVSLMIYLGQTFWPHNLAVFYPYPENGIPSSEVIVTIALFVAVSAGTFAVRRTKPYLLIGWLWFAGMLVPVLGIVQVGIQAHADRYNYLPQIGLCLIIAWGIADLTKAWRYQRVVVSTLGLIAVTSLTWSAHLQTSHWFDSQSLWEHALAATSDNEMAREHLSDAYLDKGRINDAIAQAREAVKLLPDSADAHGVLGAALARTSQLDEAISQLQSAIQLNPKLPRAHFNLGNIFLQQGHLEQAIANYESEVELYPNFSQGHNNLGNALLRAGKTDQALAHLRLALELNPNYPEAHNNLAIALSQTEGVQQAINEWEKTLRIDSKNLEAECNLAWVLSTFSDPSVRNGPKAVELAERAIDLSGGKNARIWRLAAAAYAEAGRFPEAIKAAQSGLALAKSQGNLALVETLESNIRLFEQDSPLRDSGSAGGPSSR
jgi:tetratricopeptide (TPR) repeat protein